MKPMLFKEITRPDAAIIVPAPGFYRYPENVYHDDPAPIPSLSSSTGKAILRSPSHAKSDHPRFTKQSPEKVSLPRDWGKALHKLSLGAGPEIAVVYADDWKKGPPQEARRNAYAIGETPMLAHEYENAQRAAAILRPVIADIMGGEFECELQMFWREGRQWGRTMIDAVRLDRTVVVDVKTTGENVDPREYDRKIAAEDYDYQHAFIERGLNKLHPESMGRRRHWIIAQESFAPFAVSTNRITESTLELMRRQVRASFNLWDRAMKSGEWPGYPQGTRYEVPNWKQAAWMKREVEDSTIDLEEIPDDDGCDD